MPAAYHNARFIPRWLFLLVLLIPVTLQAELLPGRAAWSDAAQWPRVVLMQDYNTRVVVTGAVLLGMAAGMIGTFMLLRKRALIGDAASHATLPGICLAFIWMSGAGGEGKALGGLLFGATISGVAGMGAILAIRHYTRIKEDAALGVVLSVFFGLGIALMGVIQNMSHGHAAGLETFIYGKTASMLARDAWLIAAASAILLAVCVSCFKEFTLLCFDQDYAAARGLSIILLDSLLLFLVVGTVVVGLQAVGLILVIALLIIPPAAARFWTDHLGTMLILAVFLGGVSGLVGSVISALAPRMPAGAIIVVTAGVLFLLSFCFGTSRGWVLRMIRATRLHRRMAHQHLLRAIYEWTEEQGRHHASATAGIPVSTLLSMRSWSARSLNRGIRKAIRNGWLEETSDGGWRLTSRGREEARRLVRNHRLWELYLIRYADIAPSHVDRDADSIEHVLGRDLVAELETLYAREEEPASPHKLEIG